MKVDKLVFAPYTNNDIFEILVRKLDEMGLTTLFQKESLIYIARKFASKSGDIRPALELIKTLILNNKEQIDSKENGNCVITLKEILIKLNEKSNNFTQLISNLTDEQKLLVATIYSTLEREDNTEIEDKVVTIKF